MKIEVLKIIEAALKNENSKVKGYSTLLANNIEGEDPNFSKEIRRILNNNTIHPIYFDEFISKPKDKDSNLEMVDVILDSDYSEGLILDSYQKEALELFVKSYEKREVLRENEIDMEFSFLLYGSPGTGKTAFAHLVAKKLELPLVIVRLDALISSLLGNTAKNIRKVFEYANSRPCILFLDEFDAIAKVRDDSKELGELKRVVNSLLQNIDVFSKKNILLAATNHEKLLDPAVWRRFNFQLDMNQISIETKYNIFIKTLNKFKQNFIFTEIKKNCLKDLIKDMNASEIKRVAISCIRKAILDEKKELSYFDILNGIYLSNRDVKSESFIKFLKKMKMSRQEISKNLNISLRQIDNELKE